MAKHRTQVSLEEPVHSRHSSCLALACLLAAAAQGQQTEPDRHHSPQGEKTTAAQVPAPADWIQQNQADRQLGALLAEALERNPGVAAADARARAAAHRGKADSALPDPVLGVTAFLKSPETRTGPQILTLNLLQELPWLSKLDLEEQVHLFNAAALRADAEAQRLALVTEIRRLYYELAFQTRQREITQDFLDHLRQHESISQSRYATGIGASQDVIKIQAEITLAENLLLDTDQRRIELEARINDLRDRPASTMILPAHLPPGDEIGLQYAELLDVAMESRPEISAADARIAATEARLQQSEKVYRPNFKVGLTYTFVDPRQDPAGMVMPPDGNGDDIFGIQGGISIPLWRKSLDARVGEASQMELSAREAKRETVAGIRASIGDLMQRLPLSWQQLRLLGDILVLQAEESVASAQSGYVSGTFNALDLLDAEHVLFDAETAIARARADYAIQLSRLEGAVGRPIRDLTNMESPSS
jgi:outer membrane protein TolC